MIVKLAATVIPLHIRSTAMVFLAAALAVTAFSRASAQTPAWAKVSPAQEEAAKKLDVPVAFENSVGMRFVLVPPGKFMMGSRDTAEEVARRCAMPNAQAGWFVDEHPRHEVTLDRAFYLSIHEVPQGSFEAVNAPNEDKAKPAKNKQKPVDYPEGFIGATLPAMSISWNDADKFCKTLNALAAEKGREYSLPTEAQWEYACRAGTTTPFSFGETISTDQANYHGNHTYGDGRKGEYRAKPVPVGTFPPNTWGLHEMHGNVSEWCADHYGNYDDTDAEKKKSAEAGARVLRGGSWRSYPGACRSACRLMERGASFNVGFRVSCAEPTKTPRAKITKRQPA